MPGSCAEYLRNNRGCISDAAVADEDARTRDQLRNIAAMLVAEGTLKIGEWPLAFTIEAPPDIGEHGLDFSLGHSTKISQDTTQLIVAVPNQLFGRDLLRGGARLDRLLLQDVEA